MKRKLISQGVGGVTLSLPINWVRKKNLKAGDEVDVIEDENALIIDGRARSSRTKEFVLEHFDKTFVRSLIASHYRRGYYELRFQFKEPQPYGFIGSIVSTLVGYEVIAQDKHSCIIRDVMREEEESANSLAIKLFQTVGLLGDVVCERLGGSAIDDNELVSLRANIFRVRDHCQRKIIRESTEIAHDIYTLVVFLEKIGGELYHLGINTKPSKQALELIKEHVALVRETYQCFLKNDFKMSARLFLRLKKQVEADYDNESRYVTLQKEMGSNKAVALACDRISHHAFAITSRLQNITG